MQKLIWLVNDIKWSDKTHATQSNWRTGIFTNLLMNLKRRILSNIFVQFSPSTRTKSFAHAIESREIPAPVRCPFPLLRCMLAAPLRWHCWISASRNGILSTHIVRGPSSRFVRTKLEKKSRREKNVWMKFKIRVNFNWLFLCVFHFTIRREKSEAENYYVCD